MSDRNWNRTEDGLPPSGTKIEGMDSSGRVTDFVYKDGLWWFPDFSMYAYFTPMFWRKS